MAATLIDALLEQADARRDATAFVFLGDGLVESSRLTYAQLELRARAIASELQAGSGGRNELALLLFPPGLEFLEGFFGCLFSGSIAVPLPAPDGARLKRTLPRLATVAQSAGASVILTTQSILALREQICEILPDFKALRWLAVEQIMDSAAAAWKHPHPAPSDIAYLQYSSGSTSMPKGVMLSHSNVLHNVSCIVASADYGPETRAVTWMPHFHDFGLVHGILSPLCSGGTAYLISPMTFLKRPIRWLQAISRYGVAYSGAPVFGYDYCARKIRPEDCRDLDLSCWQGSSVGAEPIRPEIIALFEETFRPYGLRPGVLCTGYGLAEATLFLSTDSPAPVHDRLIVVDPAALEQHRVIEAPEGAPRSRVLCASGHLRPELPVRIVNPDTFEECEPDQVGEIWAGGGSVALGYWNQPEETAKTFCAKLNTGQGDFLRTGDLGFIQKKQLFVTGRIKDLVIIGGANHYPHDIEATVEASHAALRPLSSAAFSVEVGDRERLVIVAEVKAREAELPHVHDAIRRTVVENHGINPYAVALLKPGSIPKTSSGKIRRAACRAEFLEGTLEVASEVRSPEPAQEKAQPGPESIRDWLISRFAALAGIERGKVDVHQPLALYGVTSVEAVSAVAALEDWLDRELSPTLLYRYPTIDALARGLTEGSPYEEVTHKGPADESIAIVGMGCRFPGADGPAAFWKLLHDGVDAITEVPRDRWNVDEFYSPEPSPGRMNTRWGGFLRNVGHFDPQFFSISPREAEYMDPQQRILLEVAVEALENACIAPERVAGTQAGVFVGISTSDYALLQARDVAALETHSQTGCAMSIAANRISFTFDFRGPSLAVDTACSSSMTAVHLACESLRGGHSSMALAGGVNLILTPEWTVAAAQARMMSADGRCKAFDAGADGYVRGEGCGLVVLKRLSDALRDGDPIVALIRGTAINQDGRSNGLTAPNPRQQQQVIRLALNRAGVAAHDVGYVEAHGTGTPLGDPIEIQALAAAVGGGRESGVACIVGSVKANIGHLEAAAGIAGLIKTALALSREEIPAQSGLGEINPYIKLDGSGLQIARSAKPWPRTERPRFAGVSCFGVGGSNSHAILEEAPPSLSQPDSTRPVHLLTLSAKTEPALRDLIGRFEEYLDREDDFAAIACASNIGRSHFHHRAAVVAATSRDAREMLTTGANLITGVIDTGGAPKIVFLLGNRGIRFGSDDDEVISGPALFALQLESVRRWESWGVRPDAIIGTGTGELTAAFLNDAPAPETAFRLAEQKDPSSAADETEYHRRISTAAASLGTFFIDAGNDPGLSAVNAAQMLSGRDWRTTLEGLGRLYVHGFPVDWAGFARDYGSRRAVLPNYPFQRRHYWLSERKVDSTAVAGWSLPGRRLLSPALKDVVFETAVSPSAMPLLRDHMVYGRMVFPGSAYLAMAFDAVKAGLPEKAPFSLVDCGLREALVLSESRGPVPLQTILSLDGSSSYRIVSLDESRGEWRTHAAGNVPSGSSLDACGSD